jgi:hypothetical protein
MPDSASGDEKPVTREDFDLVMRRKGTPEQVARVGVALRDKDSPLARALGSVSVSFSLMRWEQMYLPATEWKRRIEAITPVARRNHDRLFKYLCDKRDSGVLSQDELEAVCKAADIPDFDKPSLSPTEWAMCVSRMSKEVIKMHPELEAEVRALPISKKR